MSALEAIRAEIPEVAKDLRLNLSAVWFDEHADANSRRLKTLNRLLKRFEMPGDIQPSFGRYFLAILRNQTDLIGQDPKSRLHNLRRISHLEVQLCHDAGS